MRKHLATVLAACVAVAGCGSDKKTEGDVYSLTVFAYDAVTGAPIASADLAKGLVLWEGADKTSPTVLDSSVAGAVIFKDVPADYADGPNKVYPIIANIAGYLPYQGYVSFSTYDNNYYDSVDFLPRDDLFAQVGNIYLFPENFQTPSYTFTVQFGGLPVPNAVVEFDPMAGGTTVADRDSTGIITTTGVNGHVQALSATTDSNGKVTFAGSSLALGVNYRVTVLPVMFGGVQLAQFTASPINIGTTESDRTIPLTDLAPGAVNHGLYVTSISNANGQIDANGVLTIVFNVPVILNTNNGSFAAAANANITGTFNTPSANASLSTDGLTLTLTPSWAAGSPSAVNAGAAITYSGGFVSVKAYPADSIAVFGNVTTATGGAISGVVTMKAP